MARQQHFPFYTTDAEKMLDGFTELLQHVMRFVVQSRSLRRLLYTV
jgi:hypothetical protein